MTKKNRSDTTKRRKRDMTPHYTRHCPPRAAESQKARLCATPVAELRSPPVGPGRTVSGTLFGAPALVVNHSAHIHSPHATHDPILPHLS